jgi:hypothetical protein
LRLCSFASEKKKETRAKSRSQLDFFASSPLCERKEERNESQELRAKKQEPFAHKFLCVFARKNKNARK